MVEMVGFKSVDALMDATVPTAIRRDPMELGIYNQGFTESGIIAKLKCEVVLCSRVAASHRLYSRAHLLVAVSTLLLQLKSRNSCFAGTWRQRTKCSSPTLAWVTTTPTCHQSFSATCWRTPAGTPSTRPTKQRLRRAGA